MKPVQRTTSATKFERTLRQCLMNSAESTFLFDQDWVNQHGGVDGAMVRRLSNFSDLRLFEFSALQLTIDDFVDALGGQSLSGRKHLSAILRSLMDPFKRLRRGLVFVQNMEMLDEDVADLFDLLIVYVKHQRLPWKFVFLTSAKQGTEYIMVQLSVDRHFALKNSLLENTVKAAFDSNARTPLRNWLQLTNK